MREPKMNKKMNEAEQRIHAIEIIQKCLNCDTDYNDLFDLSNIENNKHKASVNLLDRTIMEYGRDNGLEIVFSYQYDTAEIPTFIRARIKSYVMDKIKDIKEHGIEKSGYIDEDDSEKQIEEFFANMEKMLILYGGNIDEWMKEHGKVYVEHSFVEKSLLSLGGVNA